VFYASVNYKFLACLKESDWHVVIAESSDDCALLLVVLRAVVNNLVTLG